MRLNLNMRANVARWLRGALLAISAGAAVAVHAQDSRNGVIVTVPNGYANITVDDMRLSSTAGTVRWTRVWDGQEWRFNPQWESLSQSWRNLTGSQTADTTGSTVTAATGSGSTASPLSASTTSGGGGGDGCWVWVDEDWQPSTGTAVIGGIPETGPMLPVRTTPFNRVMGEASEDYPPPQRVSVDYASLCAGSAIVGGPSMRDAEGIRRINELYLGDSGRYAFNNRSVLEKREVKQLPVASSAAIYSSLAAGKISLSPETNAKGFRWIDRSGDWIDYNTQGQVVAWGDRNNNIVWLVRDTVGVVRGVVDANGRVLFSLHYTGDLITEVRDYPIAGLSQDLPARSVKYQYDTKNRLTQVSDVRGNVTKYEYSVANRITKITDPEGRTEQLVYSGETVKQRIAPDGALTDYFFEYDDTNKQFISKVTGPETEAGRRVEDLTHNRVGKLVRQIVNGRTEAEVRYDTGARAEIATNARGFTTRTASNEFDQIVEVAYPDGSTIKRQYSPLHLRMTEEADEMGVKTQYQYDARGNLVKKLSAAGTSDEVVTEFFKNALGQTTRLVRKGRIESNGTITRDAVWQFEYDQLGQLSKTTDPEGGIRTYAYSRAGDLLLYTDPRGNSTYYEVDADGNLLKITDALGKARSSSYDKVGNPVRYTDARGKTAESAYDAMDRNVQTVNPAGGIYRVQYNGQGLPVSETDEDGRRLDIQYDNFQRLAKQIDGRGNTTSYDYQIADGSSTGTLGSLLQPTQIKYPTFTEQQRFDERERPTTRTVLNPTGLGTEGLVSSTKYDKRGRVIESTNAEGKTTFFTYDALGRTTKFTNSLGKSVNFTWDARSNLIEIADYNGNVTRFEYDRGNRLVKEILPLGQTTTHAYDEKGNHDTLVDPAGNKIHYVYDAVDRPIRVEVTALGETSPALVYTLTYDEEGSLTGWSDGTRSGTYTYDDDGRRLAETLNYGGGVSLSYGYSYTPAGLVKSLKYPDGTEVTFDYDAHSQLSSIGVPGEGTISVTAWNWVAPAKITVPGGTTSELAHDGLLKLTGLKVKNPGQQTIFDIANKYGPLEQLKQKAITDANGSSSRTVTTQFAYDSELRLTQVTADSGAGASTETFGVDAAGNRTSHSAVSGPWTVDANNRLVQRGDVGYQYDDSGNLVQRTVGTTGAAGSITRFKYDALNRLIEVRDGADDVIARYAYDPFDNRIVKDLYRDSAGAPFATPRRTHYLYADEGLLAEADGVGAVAVQYGWRPDAEWGTDPLFIKTSSGYAYFHNDHLGTPLRATNKDGTVVWSGDYAAFGLATLGIGNTITSNLRLGGQYFDAETGLHYNARRYYDPVIGRYVSADPLGLSGGWNSYEYAGSDPVNQLDPHGEWIWVVVRVAMTVYDVYTTYKDIKENGLCFDWTRLIPIPVKIPRIKWLTKRFKKCGNPCECMNMAAAAAGAAAGAMNSFPADTLVHTLGDEGNPVLKPIASIKLGDKVLAKSEWKSDDQSLSYEPVTDIFTTENQPRTLIHITLEDGKTITTTDGHPFKTTDGWRDAILLKKGGKLLLLAARTNGADVERAVSIVDVRQESRVLTTYNLEVANAHTFFVGDDGALVHNITRGTKRRLRDKNTEEYGRLQCVVCGTECTVPKRHKKGERPPDNEAHAGHQTSRANGGSDDLDNLEIECRRCNLANGRKNR